MPLTSQAVPSLDITAIPRPARSEELLDALKSRVVIADGAMGTMLQDVNPTLDDFQQHEGCNEILNVSRPDIVETIHATYLETGIDAVETNTFGANWSNLSDYGIESRIEELARAGAEIARRTVERFEAQDGRVRWVLGSMGPGTKLPSLGHTTYANLKSTFADQARGLILGGADALLVETSQDLLQAKSAVNGCKQAIVETGIRLPIFVEVTVETTGTMLMGSEIAAALTTLEPLGIDMIGLNCATGPAEMSEHLRHLSKFAHIPVMCMPNAGLPVLGANGASYPLTPDELATAHEQFVKEFGLGLVGGCCGTTPAHLKAVVDRVGGTRALARAIEEDPGVASLYQHVGFNQDASYLAIGERTNANGSLAFRQAMLEDRWDDCVDIARSQVREGAHLLDVCVDYVGRDGVADIRAAVSRLASASTLPLVVDSTEPAVLQAGMELIGGRPVVNSVNFEDGEGPASRFGRIMPLVKEHGAAVIALTIDEDGQARTAENKVRIASRLVDTLVNEWGMRVDDIIVDALTFPIATGQEETRRDAIETIEAIRQITAKYPGIHTTLGVSNISFGLNPAARSVLNSVFLHEAVEAGLDSAIVNAAKIVPLASVPDERRKVALDLVWDRREYDADGNLSYDPLSALLDLFAGVDSAALKDERAAELAALPVGRRLERRIIDGEPKGLEADLDLAMADGMSALDIVNVHLLAGMQVVGERFGSGEMQLPFVLQSAEVMKAAVALLEPHMEKTEAAGKGTMVIGTVRGDVHDIGKNLVDIILTNNGYEVINIGIKQPLSAFIEAAEAHNADVIGMSGLLVKSTVVMKENLLELQRPRAGHQVAGPAGRRGSHAHLRRRRPRLALRRPSAIRPRRVRGSRLDGAAGRDRPRSRARRRSGSHRSRSGSTPAPCWRSPSPRTCRPGRMSHPTTPSPLRRSGAPASSGASRSATTPRSSTSAPPSWASGGSSRDATRMARATRNWSATDGRPRLRYWLDRILAEGMLDASVAYGYFPVYSEGDDMVVLHHGDDPTGVLGVPGLLAPDGGSGGPLGQERLRFTFPRQRRDRHLCLADYVRSKASSEEPGGKVDVVGIQLVTAGSTVDAFTAKMFAENKYRDYLELNGLTMQLTEALAEYWHSRIRADLGFAGEDPDDIEGMFKLRYRGARFSLGYPACPNMEDRRKVVELLKPERMGVELSEELQLHPEQSTDAFVFHHPEARYFSV